MAPSKVWQHFVCSNKNNEATCKYCQEVLKHSRSTTCLWNHYNYKHKPENGVNTVHENSEDRSSPNKRNSDSNVSLVDSEDVPPTKKRRRSRISAEAAQKRPISKERQELITQAVTQMISMDLLPLAFVENEGFKCLMSVVEPEYKIPSRKAITGRIQALYNDEVETLKKVTNAQPTLALTTDCWTSRVQESYMTVTAQYLDSDWILHSVNLSTEEVTESHTADHLEDCIRDILEEWDLSSKVSAVVHDNASNITNAVKALHIDYIKSSPCAAHTLQLSVKAGLSSSNCGNVVKKASAVVSAFNHSYKRTNALENILRQTGKSVSRLIQSCPTRWNSTLAMLERLAELRPSIAAVLSDRSAFPNKIAKKIEICERDWEIMNELIKLLQPFKTATTVLSADTSITISLIRPIIHSLITKHLKIKDPDSKFTKDFKMTVAEDLRLRFDFEDHILEELKNEVSVSQIASFLDPRYKNLLFEKSNDRNRIKSVVREMFDQREEAITLEENETRTAMDILLCYEEVEMEDEFERYLQEPQINHNANVNSWWKEHGGMFPNLSKIAKQYLAIPATSTSSERVFSSAGNIVRPARSCLTSYMVSSLVFLHQNKKTWFAKQKTDDEDRR